MFSKIRKSFKTICDERIYYNKLLQMIMSMFQYKNIDIPQLEYFNFSEYDRNLLMFGKTGILCIDNKWYNTTLEFLGIKDDTGEFEWGSFISDNNHINVQHKFDENHLYCKNNYFAIGEFEIFKFAELLTENDKTFKSQIINTRLSPIVKVGNDKDKRQLEQIRQQIIDGELILLSSDIEDYLTNDNDFITVTNITDNKLTNNLQFIANNNESILKMFFNHYGIPTMSTNKESQVLKSEIASPLFYSEIYKNILLSERQKFWEKFNNITNSNVEVVFSSAWEKTQSLFENSNEGDNIEN